jgi:putative endonuclease
MYIYILTNSRRTLYTGVTNNLSKRLIEHKNEPYESFARKYNCDKLVHVEYFDRITDALLREKQIKSWRRSKKIELIESMNSKWDTIPIA